MIGFALTPSRVLPGARRIRGAEAHEFSSHRFCMGAAAAKRKAQQFGAFSCSAGTFVSKDPAGLTRAQVAFLLSMSDGWVALRMRVGDLPRPGLPAPAYVAAFVAYRMRRRG